MFLAKYGQGSPESPFVLVNQPLLSLKVIDELVPPGVDEVFIDEDLTLHAVHKLHKQKQQDQAGPHVPAVSLVLEFPIAEKLYGEALTHSRLFMDNVRKGKDFDYREATPMVDSFIESVFRNESAAATMIKLRRFDEYTYTHSINVSILAVLLGKHLGYDKEILRQLGIAGMFHDVGKARIPEEILNKPGKLTPLEFRIMKTHVLESYRLMSDQKALSPDVLRGIVEHHERYDGDGYPRGLSGDGIGIFGRIISIADIYDALTSKRVYKEGMPTAKALSLMYQWRDSTFPPNSIESFIKCIGVYPIGSFVRLSNGEYAIVTANNEAHAARPTVKVVLDAKMRHKPPTTVDLSKTMLTGGLEISECLNPADYRVDLSRLLTA